MKIAISGSTACSNYIRIKLSIFNIVNDESRCIEFLKNTILTNLYYGGYITNLPSNIRLDNMYYPIPFLLDGYGINTWMRKHWREKRFNREEFEKLIFDNKDGINNIIQPSKTYSIKEARELFRK